MFKYLEKEDFLSMMLLPDIAALLFIMSKFLIFLFYPELFLVLIFLLTYFLLYAINETGKNDVTKRRLKIVLRYAIFYLSIRVFASSPLFLMFT